VKTENQSNQNSKKAGLVSGGVLQDNAAKPGCHVNSMAVSDPLTRCSKDMFTSKPFWWSNPPQILRFAVAVVAVGVALVVAQAIEQRWHSSPHASLFLCAIICSAWFGGFRAGLLAVMLAALAFDYFFLTQPHSLAVDPNEIPRLVLFVASALIVCSLSAAQRRAALSLSQARDNLAAKVHEFEKSNEALQQTERHLAEAQSLSHTGSWVWNVKTQENTYWSDEHFRIYGFEPGQAGADYQQARKRIHPEDLPDFDHLLERAMSDRTDFELDYRIVLPDGRVRHIHNLGHPRFNHAGELAEYVGTTIDITERKLSEALLSSEMHTLEMIASGAALPAVLDVLCRAIEEQAPGSMSTVLSLDPDGQRLWPMAGPNIPESWTRKISPLAIGPGVGSCGTAAYTKETVVVSDIATDPLWADFRDAALSHGLRACWSKPILSNSGAVIGTFAMYYGGVRSPDEREQRLIERATHIALIALERDRIQDSLRKAQANLAHMTRVTTMGELTASIAHEVNQPLTAVINNANACLGLLPDGAAELQEVRVALTEIVDDADRASEVIARIRQLARKAPYEKTPLNLKEVVKDVLALAQYESTTRQIAIRTELTEELPHIMGDRVQLQQVLLNLIVNGMDAMNTIEQSKRVLTISAGSAILDGLPGARLSVRDSGVGFKADEMARLFEAFYTTKPQGMGMGLAISRSIIESHGGRLWAEPNAEPGATFWISLPGVGNSLPGA
jgi:signal transduction histidine kinase/PAS domain-containing protein